MTDPAAAKHFEADRRRLPKPTPEQCRRTVEALRAWRLARLEELRGWAEEAEEREAIQAESLTPEQRRERIRSAAGRRGR